MDPAIVPPPPVSVAPDPARSPASQRPRNAATLIILDRSTRRPRVLMGRRHAGLAFMGGRFVFPGGRIEPSDRHMPVAGALPHRTEAALAAGLTRAPPTLGRGLALAAIRETFEETGLLLGTREYGAPLAVPDPWTAFRDEGVLPDLESLHLVARAITPPGRVRRFDARFFATDRRTIAAERAGRVGPDAEFTEIAWVGLDEARALDLPRITRTVLDDLEVAAKGGFAPHRPIPFYRERHGRSERTLL